MSRFMRVISFEDHANLLCIGAILTDVAEAFSGQTAVAGSPGFFPHIPSRSRLGTKHA